MPEDQTWKNQGSITLPFIEVDPALLAVDPTLLANEQDPLAISSLSSASSELTALQLSAAARRIEEDEKSSSKRLRRMVRLAPLRDISADIQRDNTPQRHGKRRSAFDTLPDRESFLENVADPNATELCPWHGDETREHEQDLWANTTDPLLARSRPNAAEAAHIEATDIQRIQLEEHATLPYPTIRSARRFSIWRLLFGGLIILALSALLINGLLLSFAFRATQRHSTPQGGPPALLLSTNVASAGQTLSLQLVHFKPRTNVVLARDIQQSLLTTALTTNDAGQASASFAVSSSWGAGSHVIVAEDVTTHDTASALLQVDNGAPARPPHLLLNTTTLDLGSAVQGASTLQPLTLHNTGSGSITWSASSNQPWLLVAPLNGTVGSTQTISLAAQRSHLSPGAYQGVITFSSSAGAPIPLSVTMTVMPLAPDAGPVISLTPPLLSFTTMDGSATPVTQELTLSNPGQQRLSWSLDAGKAVITTPQNALPPIPSAFEIARQPYFGFDLSGNNTPWLSTGSTSGSLAPGQSTRLHLNVRGQNLLPGTYLSLLTFSTPRNANAYDTPQLVGVALTVQPHCGLLASTGNLSFTAITGQSNPSTHALTLNTTSSCASDSLNWQALPSASWITVSPASGQIKGTTSSVTAVGVNTTNLAPGKYTGQVVLLASKNTSTVTVQLTLQSRPAPSEPLLGVSPLSLNFSTIQAQANPAGQVLTITNNGGSTLKWHSNLTTPEANWISVTPGEGSVPPGATALVTVNVATASLAPGTYTAQIALNANETRNLPARGSPQTVSVNLEIQPPCSLMQPSARSLLFNASANGPNPVAQTVTLLGVGSCAWPLHWETSVAPAASWLTLTPSSGPINPSSQEGTLTVGVNAAGLQPGTYNTTVKINATDASGTFAQASPQSFTVSLTVQQPCALQPLPASLVFNAASGAAPASQTLTLNTTGSCNGGVSWIASSDAANSAWLSLSANVGLDNGGNRTITVTVTPGNLTPNTYTGQITISASNKGVVLQGSPQTVNVTFTLTG